MINLDAGITLHLRRTFDAPRERVFRAWTDPIKLREWWGPPGFTCPVAEMNLRAGGEYRLAMKPPDGEEFFVAGIFQEVTPPERLVYTWAWEEDDMGTGETLVTVEFKDVDRRRPHRSCLDARALQGRSGARPPWRGVERVPGSPAQHLVALSTQHSALSTQHSRKGTHIMSQDVIEQNIAINAPTSRVFRALTDASELVRWFPTEATTDARPGGTYEFKFIFDDADDNHEPAGEYREVTPDTLVSFSWPAGDDDVITEVSFSLAEVDGGTEVTLLHSGWTAELAKSKVGHTRGWTFFMRNLKTYLESGTDARVEEMEMKIVAPTAAV